MMTRGAPASMWAAAAGPSVKMPVDSITTSTPRSPHGRALGSRSAKTVKVWSPTVMESLGVAHRLGQRAVGRVVLEEVGVGGGGDQVVDADHLDRSVPSAAAACCEGGPQEVAPDTPEPVDPYPNRHGLLLGPSPDPLAAAELPLPYCCHYVSNRSTAASRSGSWPLPSGRPGRRRRPGRPSTGGVRRPTMTSTGTPWSRTARRWSSVVKPAVSGSCGRRLQT